MNLVIRKSLRKISIASVNASTGRVTEPTAVGFNNLILIRTTAACLSDEKWAFILLHSQRKLKRTTQNHPISSIKDCVENVDVSIATIISSSHSLSPQQFLLKESTNLHRILPGQTSQLKLKIIAFIHPLLIATNLFFNANHRQLKNTLNQSQILNITWLKQKLLNLKQAYLLSWNLYNHKKKQNQHSFSQLSIRNSVKQQTQRKNPIHHFLHLL